MVAPIGSYHKGAGMKTTKTGLVILSIVILSACNSPQTASTLGALLPGRRTCTEYCAAGDFMQ